METWAVYEPDGTLNSVWVTAEAARAFCQRMNCLGRGGWSWGSLGYDWPGDEGGAGVSYVAQR